VEFSSGGPDSGIYKTTDGGAHWVNITHNPGLPAGIFGNVGLAVAPSNPNVVYALIQADYQPGHPGGLFRSENAGRSWTLMNDSLDITQRAFYYMRVYVDPKDANTIYLPMWMFTFLMTAAGSSPLCIRRTATITHSGSIRITLSF